MQGLLGNYPASRDASGTAWQPDAAPHEGIYLQYAEWMVMAHGFATLIYNNQVGERGDREVFGTNMFMAMAQSSLGNGTWGLRTMLSLEPWTVGRDGYALLLQTGETADGRTGLIDRQHPHDFFMELATTYSLPVSDNSSAFVYAGLPGDPALGPPTFMHRFSGLEIPEAPITHHWLDSTHITFGVLTLGYSLDAALLESTISFAKTHTVIGRAETTEKDELFDEDSSNHGKLFHVNKISLGYIYDFPEWNRMHWGIGGLGSSHFLPSSLDEAYDENPVSFMIFVRAKL